METKNLQHKLLDIQKELKPIAKELENPYFHSKYFDIDAVIDEIIPVFNKHGLMVHQPLTHIEGKPAIKTRITDPEANEFWEETTPLMESSDIQKYGGTITYTRRYCLTSFLVLKGEKDDDGDGVIQHEVKTNKETMKQFDNPGKAYPPDDPFYEEPQGVPICDKCGKVMKEKKGSYGPFLACTGYPECKSTRKI